MGRIYHRHKDRGGLSSSAAVAAFAVAFLAPLMPPLNQASGLTSRRPSILLGRQSLLLEEQAAVSLQSFSATNRCCWKNRPQAGCCLKHRPNLVVKGILLLLLSPATGEENLLARKGGKREGGGGSRVVRPS